MRTSHTVMNGAGMTLTTKVQHPCDAGVPFGSAQFDPHAPTECRRCFGKQVTAERDYDAFRCSCETCGEVWRERLPFHG
jgi:hypothetical protein